MLEKLDNNESILLMYLTGELPPDDRAEIERVLAGDVSLRGQLAVLQAAQAATERALGGLDAAPPTAGRSALEPGSAAEAAAIRRINRSMHSHLLRTLASRPAPAARKGLRFPWWAYPSAATAASVLAFLMWYGNHANSDDYGIGPNPPAVVSEDLKIKQFLLTDDTTQDQQIRQISRQEKELAALSSGGDDDAAVWKISDSDTNE